ncbi:NADPH-dependent FMN reductase [Alkalihalobacillus sp. 1P02AB]|uniref:NADPH-dependent FMN reductase n=1 Tax=Alkalihalobacillus sp. 1P02AB TaxID=3132260 RepID=UPI0039A4DDB8
MLHIVIISGSPYKSSRLNGLITYAQQFYARKGVKAEVLHVTDIPAEALIQAQFNHEKVKEFNKKVDKADLVIVASQVYKASFTGVLKTYLDLLPQDGLKDKSVLPFVIGGSLAHLLMVDYSLKPVLSALGAKWIAKGLYTVESDVNWDDSKELVLTKQAKERIDRTLAEFIK